MADKREYGTINRVGDKWRARLNHEYLGLFDSEAEANRAIEAAHRLDAGVAPQSLRRWGATWLNERETGAQIKGIDQERSVWRSRVESAPFIDKPMRALRAREIKAWVGALMRRPSRYVLQRGPRREPTPDVRERTRALSRQSVVHALRLVKLCLDDAVIENLIPSNPARLVKVPRAKTKKLDGELVVHASKKEIASLFALDLTIEERAIYSVAVYAGLREGEIWGLRWEDVLLKGKRPILRVRRSYDGPPKSPHAIRDVPLLEPARAALAAWKQAHDPRPIAGLVFPADHGGCHYQGYAAGWPDKRDRRNGKLHVRPGLRSRAKVRRVITFHALRHTCGCHLVQGTWTPRPLTLLEVCNWLGHSSITVTERHYATLVPGNLQDAVWGALENPSDSEGSRKST